MNIRAVNLLVDLKLEFISDLIVFSPRIREERLENDYVKV